MIENQPSININNISLMKSEWIMSDELMRDILLTVGVHLKFSWKLTFFYEIQKLKVISISKYRNFIEIITVIVRIQSLPLEKTMGQTSRDLKS